MKIVAGFSSLNEIEGLIKLGAEELYCGINTKYGPINHRFNDSRCNININNLENAVNITHAQNKSIYLAANEKGYSKEQLEYIKKLVRYSLLLGIDGFIVADIMLMKIINSTHPKAKIILSCLNPCFNSAAIKFNMQFGISRVIFPRHISSKEIEHACKGIKIEKEVFFNKVAYCNNIDSFCRMHRNPSNSACEDHKSVKAINGSKVLERRLIKNLNQDLFLNPFAALYDSFSMGVECIKLGHRDDTSREKYTNTKFLAKLLDILKNHKIDKDDFIKTAGRIWKKL
ncbi:MAG: hypothetical protein D4S01_04020 [Dehalococcoidia bacterium]|nr:MAG: hypothetical protein D4S01_04020 [Dehalococcoidia bacterium]